MYGGTIVNNSGETDIGGGVANGNGLSTSTGSLTLNDSSQLNTFQLWVGNVGTGIINMPGGSVTVQNHMIVGGGAAAAR